MNNPSAFPVPSVYIEDQETNSRGMTLRDYFAAKAMQGLLTSEDIDISYATALVCYRMADHMMKARKA
jgi:hypothetical protein